MTRTFSDFVRLILSAAAIMSAVPSASYAAFIPAATVAQNIANTGSNAVSNTVGTLFGSFTTCGLTATGFTWVTYGGPSAFSLSADAEAPASTTCGPGMVARAARIIGFELVPDVANAPDAAPIILNANMSSMQTTPDFLAAVGTCASITYGNSTT